MKFRNKNFFYILLPLSMAYAGCNVIRQSRYSIDNKIVNGFYHYYYNDSLMLYIKFYGGHQPVNPPLVNYNKHTPRAIKSYFKRSLGIWEKNIEFYFTLILPGNNLASNILDFSVNTYIFRILIRK